MADPLADMKGLARRLFDETVDLRRALHENPELAFEERETTATVHGAMTALGARVLPCPTETGGIYELEGKRPGVSVLLRGDIDALPLDEETSLPFRSRRSGVMHACGHDSHAAVLVAVARALADRLSDLSGRFVFLFQPAEELQGGAKKMVDGGAIEIVRADRMLSLHLVSIMPSGLVAARPGIAMSAADAWSIHVKGAGGHNALMSERGNVVLASSTLAQSLAGVVAGMEFEGAPCACSAGVLHAGAAANVVPRRAVLHGNLRTYTESQRTSAVARLRDACDGIARRFDVEAKLEWHLHAPAVVNDPAITRAVHAAADACYGPGSAVTPPPFPPSDDVSEFLRIIPGCHVFFGACPPARLGAPPVHHAADFEIDEEAMHVATTVLATAAARLARPGELQVEAPAPLVADPVK